jgi:hypothetical protein
MRYHPLHPTTATLSVDRRAVNAINHPLMRAPIVLVAALLFSVGCSLKGVAFGPDAQDFSAALPHAYFIHRTSAHQLMVAPQSWGQGTPIIPTKVVELDHDSTWVIAKQQHLQRRSPNNPQDTYELPTPGVFSYWVLRLDKPEVWGPLSSEEFEAKRKELVVPARLKLHDVYDYRP